MRQPKNLTNHLTWLLIVLLCSLAVSFYYWLKPTRPGVAPQERPLALTDQKNRNEKRAGSKAIPLSGLAEPNEETKLRTSAAYGKLPLSFELNQGQTDSQVKFLARGSGYGLFLTSTEAILSLRKTEKQKDDRKSLPAGKSGEVAKDMQAVLRMKLLNANSAAQVTGIDELPGKTNYFIGNDPGGWRTNVSNYGKVHYKEVYPGVDLIYYGNQQQLEYDFVVAPGANPTAIQLCFEGAERMQLAADGALVLYTTSGEIRQHKPLIYQEVEGERQEVAGRYVVSQRGEVGFEISNYDPGRELIIDPTLVYSTYLGGAGLDGTDTFNRSGGIAVDTSGNAYVTGVATSSNFPTTPGTYQSGGQNGDAFVTKLNSTGTFLVYSTYLGGSAYDWGTGIAVDVAGNAYVTGSAGSGFPTTVGAYQTTYVGMTFNESFITKLNAAGNALTYSTYLGSGQGGNDTARAIAIDSNGNAYVTGQADSLNFPFTPGAFQTANGLGFVTKLNASGSALSYSARLGGYGSGIAIDSNGNAFVTGNAGSNFVTTPGAFQAMFGGSTGDALGDAFITKLNATGSNLVYSTYLGGSGNEISRGVAVDPSGNVYLMGVTDSQNFPTSAGAFQASYGGGAADAYISKLNASGSALVYSTYLGGSDGETTFVFGTGSIAIDSVGNASITGSTGSSNFPRTVDALQLTYGGGIRDAFVTKLNSTGSSLIYSTFLGGSGNDVGLGIAMDSSNSVFVLGATYSTDFPITPGAPQATFGGGYDAFVAKISGLPSPSPSPSSEVVLRLQSNFSVSDNASRGNPVQVLGSNLSGTFSSFELKYEGRNAPAYSYNLIILEYQDSSLNRHTRREFFPIQSKSTHGLGVHTDVWRALDYSAPIVFNPAKFYAVMLYQLDSKPLGASTDAYPGGCYVQEEPGGQFVACNPTNLQDIYFVLKVYDNRPPPAVFSITPSMPVSATSDQDIVVSGTNFQPNLTVDISSPGSVGTLLSGAQIQNVTETSFIMRATLNAPGSWSIKVKNPDDQASASFPFTVSSGGINPFITSINPNSPTANGVDQNVIVTGGNFQNGLRVNATFPSGGISTLQGTGQIQNVTPSSFTMRITLNAEGAWKIRVMNPDNSQSSQFAFNVQPSGSPPTGLPTSILSPVIGSLRVTASNQGISDGKWEFNQHKTSYHTPTGGISLSNDTYAWDVNLYTSTNANADAGKAVFAVADGVVVRYVGALPGGGPGAVLIAHPNAQNPVWFSGYLHMANVRVTVNQSVNVSTVIGEIGRTGADNDHLHFVIYSGQNTRGNLQSFSAGVTERSLSTDNAPTISSIEPVTVNQSNDPQLITIRGTNFRTDSIIEAQDPNGQSFTITREAIPGSTGQITGVTATTMTARVPFAFGGNYEFAVVNRPNGTLSPTELRKPSGTNVSAPTTHFAVSSSCPYCGVYSTPVPKIPVIIIPGIMGSRIGERVIGNFFEEIFPSLPLESIDHFRLRNFVGLGSPIDQRPIVATDILKTYLGFKDVYGTLIDSLTGSYRGYKLYKVRNPNERTLAGCSTGQTDANLFVFPYDWRSSNDQSARDLKGFVDCIKKIHDPNSTNPNFKVNIIAHSMGGIVARRYILEGLYGTTQNYDPKVNKLVTLGTPWLGAPKFILALETGEVEGISTGLKRLMFQDTLRYVARYMPGAHELVPSRAYTDELRDSNPGDFPFGESGWDFNGSTKNERIYGFPALEAIMNRHTPDDVILPGTNTDVFHDKRYLTKPLQDNWSGDQTGVTYYNFIGRCLNDRGELNTIGSIIATSEWYLDWRGSWREKKYLATRMTRGDCTVPEISSMRQSNNGNYLGPAITGVFENVDHAGLPNNPRVISAIDCLFAGGESNLCIDPQASRHPVKNVNQAVATPAYSLKILGSPMVLISDSFGNTTNPLSTSSDEGVATISTTVTGEDSLSSLIPLDQNYNVSIKTSASPLVITVLKTEGLVTTLAIRYLDLSIPPDVLATLELTPQGVTALKYDSDGNGTYDTVVNPTISVTGTQATDIDPPIVTVTETPQNGTSQIVLAATDAGTGVQRIMYSLNGTNYQPYTSPLTIDPSQTPNIHAFADDNVANRSSRLTYQLGTVGISVDSIAALAGRVSGGQQIALTGVFAGLSTVTMGGVVASWSYTNGGADTSAITITTPAHSVGAVQIDLTSVSGSGYSKPNAFAYLPTVFTDDTLTIGVTTVKAQHIIELRQAVDALRAVAGLAPAPWTDATLTPFSSIIKAIHILELRNYLDDAAGRLGYTTSPYTDPTLGPGITIKRIHIEELRQRIRNIAG